MIIGDELICKCDFRYKLTRTGIFKKNKKYKIQNIINIASNLYMNDNNLYNIDNNFYSEQFVTDHFYSEQEIRKLKLKKLKK